LRGIEQPHTPEARRAELEAGQRWVWHAGASTTTTTARSMMALQTVVDSLEGMAEAVAAEYTAGDDGKFYLGLEGAPRGFTANGDVAELNTKLEEFRTNNRQLNRELEAERDKAKAFEGIDPDEARKALETKTDLKAKGVNKADDIEALLERATAKAIEPLKAQVDALTADNEGKASALAKSELGKALAGAAATAHVADEALDDFVARGEKVFSYRDGAVVAVDENGAPVFNPEKPAERLTPASWAANLTSSAPHLFRPNSGGGGGGGGGGVGATKQVANDPLDIGKNAEAIAKGEATVVDSE
jgi:hypothetical protein